LAFDWTEMAGGTTENAIPNELVPEMSLKLASSLDSLYNHQSYALDSLHLFGHSLGAGVVAKGANSFIEKGYNMPTSVTLFDAPEKSYADLFDGIVNIADDVDALNESGVLVHNIYSTAHGVDLDTPGIGKPYIGAFNVGVTDRGHSGVRDLYFSSLESGASDLFYNLQDSAISERRGIDCAYSSFLEEEFNCHEALKPQKSNQDILNERLKREAFSPTGLGNAVPINYKLEETTLIECIVNNTDCDSGWMLVSGSPIYLFQELDITKDILGFSGSFLPVDWDDGDSFSIFADDTLIYSLDSEFFKHDEIMTGLLDLTPWGSSIIDLTYLYNSNHTGNKLLITEANLVYSTVDVSEPTTLLVFISGLLIIFSSRLKLAKMTFKRN